MRIPAPSNFFHTYSRSFWQTTCQIIGWRTPFWEILDPLLNSMSDTVKGRKFSCRSFLGPVAVELREIARKIESK